MTSQELFAWGAILYLGSAQVVHALGVDCGTPPEMAAVKLFEIIEDPRIDLDRGNVHTSVFSDKLLSRSSNESVNIILRSARSTYQDNRTGSPLSDRLLSPPTLVQGLSKESPIGRDATVRVLSLSTRGKIEQRMAITCERGMWKIEGLSYGPPEGSNPLK